jgi:hypothetical protein
VEVNDGRSIDRENHLDIIVSLEGTLEPEVVKYLWDSFGHVLPNALHDVGVSQPKNPIQQLAHKILFRK